jgi:hypothetical protein
VHTDFDRWLDEDDEEEADREAAFDVSKLESMDHYREPGMEPGSDSEEDDMPDLQPGK